MPPTRRTLLQTSALGLAGAIAGCAGASESRQETETTPEATTTTPQPDDTIVLGAQVEYWYGVAPSSIQGTQNPTLAMQPGTVYEIVWVNLDSVGHRLRVFDADDNVVATTEAVSTVGETTSVVLEATESLARYDCEFHPQSMRGDVSQGEATTTTTTTESDGGDGGDGGGGGGPGY